MRESGVNAKMSEQRTKSIESLAEAFKVSITLTKNTKGRYTWEVKCRNNDPMGATIDLIKVNDIMIERWGSEEDEQFHSTVRGKERKK